MRLYIILLQCALLYLFKPEKRRTKRTPHQRNRKMPSFSKNPHSYQNAVRVFQSEDETHVVDTSDNAIAPRYNWRTLLVSTLACVLVGSVALSSSSGSKTTTSSSSSSSSSRQEDRFVTTDTGGLWGSSSHKKGHHHEKKHKHHTHDDNSKYKVHPGLRLEGYPSLEIQEQYMKDLQEIDWDAVEADLEALMTQNQDCKGNPVLSFFDVAGYCGWLLLFLRDVDVFSPTPCLYIAFQ